MAAINSEVGAIDVKVMRVRDLDLDELRLKEQFVAAEVAVGTGATYTVTPSDLLKGFITGNPGGAATYTLPTGAVLVAAMPGVKVGERIHAYVANTNGTNAITFAAGASGSTIRSTTLTVTTNASRKIGIVITNVTASSEAYIAYLA